MVAKSCRQLEIRWVNLDPTRGSETRKKRPCVILQSDLVNRGSRTIIVAPILPGHKDWPFAVNVAPTKKKRFGQGPAYQSETTPRRGCFAD